MKEPTLTSGPWIRGAVEELRRLIAGCYPDPRFDVFERDDPEGVRLRATVDVEDTDEVMDVVMDPLYDFRATRHTYCPAMSETCQGTSEKLHCFS